MCNCAYYIHQQDLCSRLPIGTSLLALMNSLVSRNMLRCPMNDALLLTFPQILWAANGVHEDCIASKIHCPKFWGHFTGKQKRTKPISWEKTHPRASTGGLSKSCSQPTKFATPFAVARTSFAEKLCCSMLLQCFVFAKGATDDWDKCNKSQRGPRFQSQFRMHCGSVCVCSDDETSDLAAKGR